MLCLHARVYLLTKGYIDCAGEEVEDWRIMRLGIDLLRYTELNGPQLKVGVSKSVGSDLNFNNTLRCPICIGLNVLKVYEIISL